MEGTSDMVRIASKQFLKFKEIDFEMQKYTLKFRAAAVSEKPDYRDTHKYVRVGNVAHRRGQSLSSSHLARHMSQGIRLGGERTPA